MILIAIKTVNLKYFALLFFLNIIFFVTPAKAQTSCAGERYDVVDWGTDRPPTLGTPVSTTRFGNTVTVLATDNPSTQAARWTTFNATYAAPYGGNPLLDAAHVDIDIDFSEPVNNLRFYVTDLDFDESINVFGELNGAIVTPQVVAGPLSFAITIATNADGSVSVERPGTSTADNIDERYAVFVNFVQPVDRIFVRHERRQNNVVTRYGSMGMTNVQACADFTDAPSNFGDTYHSIANNLLTLGASVEGDLMPGNDIAAAVDDDNGIAAFPSITSGASTYTVPVALTNSTGSSATVCGWVDFDLNGSFGDNTAEEICVTIADGDTSADLTFNINSFNAFDPTANYYARFRICETASECDSPTSIAPNGEVEDYLLPVNTLPVILSSVSSQNTSGKIKLDWSTSSELFNVGFQLWGLDGIDQKWEKLHNWLVRSGSGNAVEPQTYSKTVSIPASVNNLIALGISSVDSDGTEHYYGPFNVGQSYGNLNTLKPIAWDHIRKGMDAQMASKGYVKNKVNGYRKASGVSSAVNSESVLELTVSESGMYRITAAQLARSGLDLTTTAQRKIAVVNHAGEPVVRYILAKGSGSGQSRTLGTHGELYFYANAPQGHDALYTLTSHYRVVVDATQALVAPIQVKQGVSSGFSDHYREQLIIEVDNQYALASQTDDPWVERTLVTQVGGASVAAKVITLPSNVNQAAGVDILMGVGRSSGLAPLDANQNGVQDPEHVLSGAIVDDSFQVVWLAPQTNTGTGIWNVKLPIPTTLGDVDATRPGLQVNVGASFTVGEGYAFSQIQLDYMGLEYSRSYTAKVNENHLSFTAPNRGELGYAVVVPEAGYVLAFAHDGGNLVRLLPESQLKRTVNGKKQRLVKVAQLNGSGSAAADRSVNYWVSGKRGYLSPDSVSIKTITSAVSLLAKAQTSNYLMIAHPAFINDTLRGYANHKRDQGYKVSIIDYLQVVEAFGGGQAGTTGLTRYLSKAESQGNVDHVLLVGGSVYDHLDRLGTGGITFIPGHYGKTRYSNFTVSDTPYVDSASSALFASVGRWPVREGSELESIVDKSKAFSEANHSNGQVLSIAEHMVTGENIDFSEALTTQLEPLLPANWGVSQVHVDNIMANNPSLSFKQALNQAKGQIIDRLNNAPDVVLFNGHGTTSQLSNKGLFRASDAGQVTVSGAEIWLPMSCYVTYYESTHINTLAHQLMFTANAVGIAGATLLSSQGSNIAAGKAILNATVNNGTTLGEAVNAYKAAQNNPTTNINISVLGDSTLKY